MSSLKKTRVLKAGRKNISYSAKVLRSGGLVAFPTETVYGLGADLFNKKAISRLYKVKKRPRNKPFAILIADEKTIKKTGCALTVKAKALIDEFWPGPLTIILKSKAGRKVGFRMPDNKIALEVVKKAGVPVACPSANISGTPAPKTAREVLEYLDGEIEVLLDGGKSKIGIESTVVDLTVEPPEILREGAIKRQEIAEVITNAK